MRRLRRTDGRLKKNRARRQRIRRLKSDLILFALGALLSFLVMFFASLNNNVSAQPNLETMTPVEPVIAVQKEPTTMQEYISIQGTSPINADNLAYLESVVLPLTRVYGIPDALVAGQWAAEGRFINPRTNNYWNLMFAGKVHYYESLEKAARDYDLTLRDIASRSFGISKAEFEYEDYSAVELINALQTGKKRFEGHSNDPMEYVRLVTSTPEFRYFNKLEDKK